MPSFGEEFLSVGYRVEEKSRVFGSPGTLPRLQAIKLEGFPHTSVPDPGSLREAVRGFVEGRDPFLFVLGSVTDRSLLEILMDAVEGTVHLAAETHVDRSILDPEVFIRTDVLGTYLMLETAREAWSEDPEGRAFLHMSTDEVYGEILDGSFTEDSPLAPRSPYSSSKAAADRLACS